MFGKKNKEAEPFTPRDLDSLAWKNHKGIREESEQITKEKKRRRIARWIMLIIIIIIILLWLYSCLATKFGDLVVTVDDGLASKGVILSETADFEKTYVKLSGPSVDDVYHFSYNWFEDRGVLDDLDNIDGSHNGKDYFAYTYYIRNNGSETFPYDVSLEVTGTAKGCDEAARIMVYKNGEPTVYAKPVKDTDIPEKLAGDGTEDTVPFKDNDTVFSEQRADFAPGDTDKYTVVIWFEGEDSQCINDIMGGHMRLSMLFEAAELEE